MVLGLLAVLLIGGYPYYSPALKGLLPGAGDAPPAESAVSSGQEAPPARTEPPESSRDSAASTENTVSPPEDETPSVPAETEETSLWKSLWSKVTKLWPVLLVLIAVMEAAEYIGKFFALIRKFFHFLGDQF